MFGITVTKAWILLAVALFPGLTKASIPKKVASPSYKKITVVTTTDLPDNYQSLSAERKLDILWENCIADTTPVGHSSNLEAAVVFIRDMNKTFDHVSDERPWKRKKPIHGTGPVVKAKFDALQTSPYTGIFKGCPNVLLRLAVGIPPKPGMFLPGVSAKFLRSGKPSGNMLALRKEGTQKNTMDWFQDMMSHKASSITPPIGWFLSAKFKQASKFAVDIGVSELADYDVDGKRVTKPKFPFEMSLLPNPELDSVTLETLEGIKSGTKLYDVYAKENENSASKKIGSITSTSKMTSSKYGDLKLFFQHQRREEDLERMEKCPFSGVKEEPFLGAKKKLLSGLKEKVFGGH